MVGLLGIGRKRMQAVATVAACRGGRIMHNYECRSNAKLTPSDRPMAAVDTADPAPRTLARRALYEDVADRLRQQIFTRRLEPGSWIDELKLCAEYGISRTPLREALKVLAVEGLVTMKLRRGAYVTEMSRDDVAQVYHLLALLESDAAAEVASRATDAQLAELRTLHERLEKQARQRDAFFATNEQFHMKLLDVAGNRWRTQIVTDLRKVMKLNRHHSLFKQGRLADSLAEHRALMQALESRQAERARQLMKAHFDHGLEAAA
jgi:DNA-binding GntR family transcriptional regulator